MRADDSGLQVTGGQGGVGAALEDLSAAAARLVETAAETAEAAVAVLRVATSPAVLLAALLRPVEGAQLEAGLVDLAGPRGLGGEAVALGALASALRCCVLAYAAGERGVAQLVESVQDTAVWVVSRQLPWLATGALALEAAGVDVAGAADHAAFVAPSLVDLVGGVEGAVAGPATPLDYEDALVLLARAGATTGRLSEAGRAVLADPRPPTAGARAPTSVADLVGAQLGLGQSSAGPSRVRIVQVPQPDGSSAWVAIIPGTQDWAPRAGANPSDVTSDLLLMAGESTLLAAGVTQALEKAQAQAGRAGLGEPVLLAGHSQGGIAAAALAADPGFRRRHPVGAVVTSGAPIARMGLPPQVSVLALEHSQDPVPRLEGTPNPDRRSWVTVTREVGADLTADPRASRAHDARLYLATARSVDQSSSASVRAARQGSAPFLCGDANGPAVIRDYSLRRVPAPQVLVARSAG